MRANRRTDSRTNQTSMPELIARIVSENKVHREYSDDAASEVYDSGEFVECSEQRAKTVKFFLPFRDRARGCSMLLLCSLRNHVP